MSLGPIYMLTRIERMFDHVGQLLDGRTDISGTC